MAIALAFASTTTVLAGCMSAGDGATTFGFEAEKPLAGLAETAAPAASGDAEVGTAAEGSAEPPAEDAAATLTAAAASEPGEAVAAAGHATGAAPSPAGAESASAATPERSGPLSALAMLPARARQSDRSLYASLFTEAEARTPLRNADADKSNRVLVTQTDGSGKAQVDAALPGVDPSSLFEIGQRASADDPELLEDIGGSYQMASLSGLARLAPNGLLVQRDDIVTNCFGSDLVGLLRQIERRFGQKVVITSGYRSPAHNKRVRGAKASMHMACKAADLHVPGVSGAQVASFVRGLPNRGGVGTYCHTAAVHVDVGRKRDWNWACRRRQQS